MRTARLEEKVALLTLRLRQETAASKIMMALRELEQRNWEDQPRIPSGRWDGGRWTTESGSSDESRNVAGRATLLDQRLGVGEKGLIRHCTYIDSDGKMTTLVIDAIHLCPPFIHV